MSQHLTLEELIRTKLEFGTTLTAADIVISLAVTFVIALFIYFIYKKTYTGVLYSQEFNVTLIIVSMVVAVIMIGISRNIALSLGLIGALSIVRFRNAIKDPKDVTFLFWAISVGIVNGVQFYKLSIISSIFIGIVLVVFSKRMSFKEPYVIVLKYSSLNEDDLTKVLQKYCDKYKMRSTTFTGDLNDRTLEVRTKKGKENALLENLRKLNGVSKIMMFTYSGKLSE